MKQRDFPSFLYSWDAEVFILQGDSRQDLIRDGEQLLQSLSKGPVPESKDLAFTLNSLLHESGYRLAIVANSLEDFQKKLAHALQRLADPKCTKIKDRSGIFFFEEPLSREGNLAFLFPGEGSQYVNMLSDLCLHFPDVRACFDRADRVFFDNKRDLLPSQVLFPPVIQSTEKKLSSDGELWQMDYAVATVSAANQALFAMLSRLGIRPHAVVGHSSGEYTALQASGAVGIQDEDQLLHHSLDLNGIYGSLEEQIPEAALMAVGAADSTILASAVAESDGALSVAMDNCPHQVILCGAETAVVRARDRLQNQGAICNVLPFNRAYHTPLFEPVCEHLSHFFRRLRIVPPHTTIYSCATALPFPRDPAEIRQLAVEQWARPVRFRETIEAMYDAGVRIFVEVGPKANLTSFVDDILRNRRYLAVPSNISHRSGITQLNYLIGLLAAHGVAMRLDYLYARRTPKRLSLKGDGEPSTEICEGPGATKLALELPRLELRGLPSGECGGTHTSRGRGARHTQVSDTEAPFAFPGEHAGSLTRRSPVREDRRTDADEPFSPSSTFSTPVDPDGSTQSRGISNGLEVLHQQPVPVVQSSNTDNRLDLAPTPSPAVSSLSIQTWQESDLPTQDGIRSQVMEQYLQTMEQFLATQQEVMMTFMAKADTVGAGAMVVGEEGTDGPLVSDRSPWSESQAPQGPFRMAISSLIPGEEVIATCRLDLDEHLFLRHHTIGHQPSALDSTLIGLPVVPLSISLEMMAQVASLLLPDKRLLAMKKVRAHRWIVVEEQCRTLLLTAKRKVSDTTEEVEVRILEASVAENLGSKDLLIVEGNLVFGDEYPEPPRISAPLLQSERPYRFSPEQYYREVMFHGPSFQSVTAVDRCGENGVDATVRIPPRAELFHSNMTPRFYTDPVLLDAAGQLVGFWAADRLEKGFVVFPIGFNALYIYGPWPQESELVKCHARTTLLSEKQIRSNIEFIGSGGRLCVRLVAWDDMRFDFPRQFVRFVLSPRDVTLCTSWTLPISHFPSSLGFQCCRLDGFPDALFEGAVWPRAWARIILSRGEQEAWLGLSGPEKRRREWLAGRLAAKDAVRLFLKDRYQLDLCPADIEIAIDEHGRPTVGGELIKKQGCHLSLSIAHSGGRAVAVVGECGDKQGLGVDIECIGRSHRGLEKGALTAEEQALLLTISVSRRDEWLLRLWCAKEAVAKALGRGMAGSPLNLVVQELEADTGRVTVALAGQLAQQQPAYAGRFLTAFTGCEDDLIFASSLI